jgi:nitroimidazol reductase NimA-like FMN-containing flavoprotein (pyridoxamine 5'-phosphate oxidase superfamily)
MRKMIQKEIKDFINNHTWTTLCTVSAEGSPYAIEFNYFLLDSYICGLIKPNGTTAKNIAGNHSVCLKMCKTDDSCREFTAVSCFGKGEFVHDEDSVLKGWDLLEERLKLPKGTYAKFKERFIKKKNKYPMFRMKPEKMTGVTSVKTVTSNE